MKRLTHSKRDNGLATLCQEPRLTVDEESRLFAKMKSLRANGAAFFRVRNRIVTANLRLVVAVARSFATSAIPTEDFVAAGLPVLIRAVELFDPARGYRFSTYATHAVRNHFLRMRKRQARHQEREINVANETIEQSTGDGDNVNAKLEQAESLSSLQSALNELPPRDQLLLSERFGIGIDRPPQTFLQISRQIGLSKERVRVLTHRALARLSELLAHPVRQAFQPDTLDRPGIVDLQS